MSGGSQGWVGEDCGGRGGGGEAYVPGGAGREVVLAPRSAPPAAHAAPVMPSPTLVTPPRRAAPPRCRRGGGTAGGQRPSPPFRYRDTSLNPHRLPACVCRRVSLLPPPDPLPPTPHPDALFSHSFFPLFFFFALFFFFFTLLRTPTLAAPLVLFAAGSRGHRGGVGGGESRRGGGVGAGRACPRPAQRLPRAHPLLTPCSPPAAPLQMSYHKRLFRQRGRRPVPTVSGSCKGAHHHRRPPWQWLVPPTKGSPPSPHACQWRLQRGTAGARGAPVRPPAHPAAPNYWPCPSAPATPVRRHGAGRAAVVGCASRPVLRTSPPPPPADSHRQGRPAGDDR